MRRLDGDYKTFDQKPKTLHKYGVTPRNMYNVCVNVFAHKDKSLQEVKGIIQFYKKEKGCVLMIGINGIFEMTRKEYLKFMYK